MRTRFTRFYKFARILLDELTLLEVCCPHIERAKTTIARAFTEAYGAEFSVEKNGSMVYDNSKFEQCVIGEKYLWLLPLLKIFG